MAFREFKAKLDLKEQQDQMLVCKAHKESKENKEFKENKVFKDSMDIREYRDFKDLYQLLISAETIMVGPLIIKTI